MDPMNPSASVLDFGCYLGRLTKSTVTGIFLDNRAAAKTPVLTEAHATTWPTDEVHLFAAAEKQMAVNIDLFRRGCASREVNYAVHRDHGVPATDMISESRFADILVADADTSFRRHFEGPPTEFVKDLLKDAECPVIIAPQSFESIDELIFAYNGTASCMFAIKQFTYLFPQLANKKTTLLIASQNGKWEDVHKHALIEWLKTHYTDLHSEILRGEGVEPLFDYSFNKRTSWLVMGAYGRNALSQFLRPSTANLLIKTITQPIFIAHR